LAVEEFYLSQLQPPTPTLLPFTNNKIFKDIFDFINTSYRSYFMHSQDSLILTQADFQKLSSLLSSAQTEIAELLEEELGRATIVPNEKLPQDVVSMNATVSFQDLDTRKESVVTLVYPHEANIDENKISILAPVGSALIGLRVGQIINWPVPNGKEKRLKVISVLYQPEAKSN
jgi:regulator of nucleoside diphosphate kinase